MPATDIERAKELYEGVLRLSPSRRQVSKAGEWNEYDLGSTTLAVTSMIDSEWQPSKHGAAAALEVADFDEAIEWLRAHNVRFQTQPWESSTCKMATLFDPDGGCIAIHQLKRKAAEPGATDNPDHAQ